MHDSMMPYAEYVIHGARAAARGGRPKARAAPHTVHHDGAEPSAPTSRTASARASWATVWVNITRTATRRYTTRWRAWRSRFVMRGMLVDGHGNFGTVDGDSPAAMRYTEARMTPLALELLRDIDKDTVPFRLNFDDTLKEPDMLPAQLPEPAWSTARASIAVGLATNIPPHNLREVIERHRRRRSTTPTSLLDELMQLRAGAPTSPPGGRARRHAGGAANAAYEIGARQSCTLRARTHHRGRARRRPSCSCITEMPYQVNKAALLEQHPQAHRGEERPRWAASTTSATRPTAPACARSSS